MRASLLRASGVVFVAALACVLHSAGCSISTPPSYGIASGAVLETDTNAPLGGAFVVLAGYEATTDADGAFLIDPVVIPSESEERYLTASCDGFRTYDAAFSFSAPGSLALHLDPVDNRDLAGTLDGVVLGDLGTGLTQAKVTVAAVAGASVVDTQTAHTSFGGNWQMSGIPIGTCRIETTAEGWLPDLRWVTVYPGQGSNRFLTIEMVAGTSRVSVTGRVFDVETQAPIAGAVVGDEESARTVTTAEDGTYNLPDVLVGQRTFRATAAGYDPSFVSALILAEPDAVDLGLARATGGPPAAPGTIAGRVTVEGEGTSAGVRVALLSGTGTELEARTLDEEGTFGFFVVPGSYRLTVSKTGYAEASLDVLYRFGVPVRNLAVRLRPAG